MTEHALGVMIAFSRDISGSIRNQGKRKWGDYSRLGELAAKPLPGI
ncbi:hypothetical protein [Paenibacillus sp. HW567]|nr:hypothetical protein [Paenibacillus sp. HW567]